MSETTDLPQSTNAEEGGAERGYMCLIDWEWELGAASGGNRVYPSVEDLLRCHTCADACGVVEVEVRITRLVSAGTGE
jgi:hypothetical protein